VGVKVWTYGKVRGAQGGRNHSVFVLLLQVVVVDKAGKSTTSGKRVVRVQKASK
jgi:hypothetical protein